MPARSSSSAPRTSGSPVQHPAGSDGSRWRKAPSSAWNTALHTTRYRRMRVVGSTAIIPPPPPPPPSRFAASTHARSPAPMRRVGAS